MALLGIPAHGALADDTAAPDAAAVDASAEATVEDGAGLPAAPEQSLDAVAEVERAAVAEVEPVASHEDIAESDYASSEDDAANSSPEAPLARSATSSDDAAGQDANATVGSAAPAPAAATAQVLPSSDDEGPTGTAGGTIDVPGMPGSIDVSVWLSDPAETSWFGDSLELTDGAGTWEIEEVPTGDYIVELDISRAGITSWYDGTTGGAADRDGAIEITVTEGERTTVNLSAPAPTGTTVSGAVQTEDGLPAVDVLVSISDTDDYDSPDIIERWATTRSDGTYTLYNVPPGTAYRVAFWTDHGPRYWDGEWSWDEATVLEVGTTPITGIDGEVPPPTAISGTATNPDGTPREGDLITLYTEDGHELDSTSTDTEGRYAFDLGWAAKDTGSFFISLTQGGWGGALTQFYDGSETLANATAVTVREGESRVIDFVADPGATISGSVVFANDTPASGAVVELYRASSQFDPVQTTVVAEDGSYTFTELSSDNYAVRVNYGETPSSNVVTRWLGGDGSAEKATAIALGAAQSITLDAVTVERAVTIAGSVIVAEGVSSVYVSVNLEDDADVVGRTYTDVSMDGLSGTWEIKGLPAGRWTASAYADTDGVEGQFWGGGSDRESATYFTLAAGEEKHGVDFSLGFGSLALSGTITAADGSADASDISATLVLLQAVEDESVTWTNQVARAEASGGRYAIYGVAPGTYTLSGIAKDADGYFRAYDAPVTIGADATTHDVVLQAGVPLGGVVRDAATNEAVPYVSLHFSASELESDWFGAASLYADEDGRFSTSVPWAVPGELTAPWPRDPYPRTSQELRSFGVSGDQNVVLSLNAGVSVSGGITSENLGTPVANVSVDFYDANGEWFDSVSTDGSGRYSTYLRPGTYTVEFANWNGLYVTKWHDNKTTAEAANPVTVASEPVTLDARLSLGAVITGQVLDGDGEPIVGARVGLAIPPSGAARLFTFFTGFTTSGAAGGRLIGVETTTDSGGTFRLPAVDPGSYALYVAASGFRTQWYSGGLAAFWLTDAESLTLSSGDVEEVEVILTPLEDGEHELDPSQTLTRDFVVTESPADVTVVEGENVTLRAAASGDPTPTIQWQRLAPGAEDTGWTDIEDENSITFTIWEAALTEDGAKYRAVFSQDGSTLISDEATVTVTQAPTAPGAPTGVRITDVGQRSFTVEWRPAAANGSAVTSYTVKVYDLDDVLVRTLELGAVTSVSVSGLDPETEYSVTVVAANAVGSSPVAESETVTTLALEEPGEVADLTASRIGQTSATVEWAVPAEDGGSPVTGYVVEVLVDGATIGDPVEVDAATTVHDLTGLDPDTSYTVRVAAVNAVGVGVATSVEFTTPAEPVLVVPSTVRDVTVAGVTETGATVSWVAPADDGGSPVTGYVVELWLDGSREGAPTSLGRDATTYALTGLDPDTAYEVRVAAVNAVGTGLVSSRTFTTAAEDKGDDTTGSGNDTDGEGHGGDGSGDSSGDRTSTDENSGSTSKTSDSTSTDPVDAQGDTASGDPDGLAASGATSLQVSGAAAALILLGLLVIAVRRTAEPGRATHRRG